MKKDIQIPEVTGVKVVAVLEHNTVFKTEDWNVYIVNEKEVALDMVVVVSKGYDEKRETSVMRKKLDTLPPKSFAKIELIQPDLFELVNQFHVSFFLENKLLDKTFHFPKKSISEKNLRFVSALDKRGVLAK